MSQHHRGRGKRNTFKNLEKRNMDSRNGGRWRRQHKTELDGDKWSVAYMLDWDDKT